MFASLGAVLIAMIMRPTSRITAQGHSKPSILIEDSAEQHAALRKGFSRFFSAENIEAVTTQLIAHISKQSDTSKLQSEGAPVLTLRKWRRISSKPLSARCRLQAGFEDRVQCCHLFESIKCRHMWL